MIKPLKIRVGINFFCFTRSELLGLVCVVFGVSGIFSVRVIFDVLLFPVSIFSTTGENSISSKLSWSSANGLFRRSYLTFFGVEENLGFGVFVGPRELPVLSAVDVGEI